MLDILNNRLNYLNEALIKTKQLYNMGSIDLKTYSNDYYHLLSRREEIVLLIETLTNDAIKTRESYYYKNIDSDKNKYDITHWFPITIKIGDSKYFNLNEDSIKAINQYYDDNKDNIK